MWCAQVVRARRVILLQLACVIAAVSILSLWLWNREPVYQGRTLTEWILLHELSRGENSAPRNSVYNPSALRESEEAVRQIGTNAWPWLLKWIQCKSSFSGWRHKLGVVSDKLPGGQSDTPLADRLLADPDWVKEAVGLAGFRMLGTNASGAVPDLLRLIEDRQSPALTQKVLSTLFYVDDVGMPHLLAILQDPKDPLRAEVVSLFIFCDRLGTNSTLAARLLSECVRDKDTELAERAIESLGGLKCELDITVPALVNGLEDPRVEIRSSCAWSLSWLGPPAKASVPALVASLQDTNSHVSYCASIALYKIAPEVLERLKLQTDGKR